jgi:UDP-N-acetylmuramoyl-tripeptide--D-alanyl-D-alanine ligase
VPLRIQGALDVLLAALALLWRRLLTGPSVVAITGSVGKTTAKECLAAILASRFPITYTPGNSGGRSGLPRTLLRTRRRHRFVVAEVAILKPGIMWRSAWLLKPDIAVVLSVRWQHSVNFRGLEHIAAEKAKLLRGLRRGGRAVLNGDDPLVARMADPARFAAVRFGTSPDCDVRASDASARWPDRLRFQVHAPEGSRWVQTRLVGPHWVPSVLAAIAAARACGVGLDDSVRALREVDPFPARMQPIALPSGAILLRDEYNGTMDTLLAALRVLEEATALRRVAVVGSISDTRETPEERPRRIGREVARVADTAIFVGELALRSAEAAVAGGMDPREVHAFPHPAGAAEFLRRELREGDLALLKGVYSDHLSRLYFAQVGTVGCWVETCPKAILCDDCPELRPSGPPDSPLPSRAHV